MRRLLALLDRYWFTPAPLRDLALVRILAFGSQTLFFIVVPNGGVRSLSRQIAQTSAGVTPYEPLPVLQLLLLPWGPWGSVRPDAAFLQATFVVAVVAGLLATVGLYARLAMPVAALANTLIVAHWFSFGDHHHAEALMLIALNVVALSPAAETWSVDALRRRRAGRPSPRDVNILARWPLLLMQWLIALTYLSAAGSKLVHGGTQWFNGYSMTYHFLRVGLTSGNHLAQFMAALPPRMQVAPSILTFLFELTFVVAVLAPRTAWFYVLAGVAFHLAVYATMGIAFFQTILLYSVFIGSLRLYWPRALSLPRARPGAGGVTRAADPARLT